MVRHQSVGGAIRVVRANPANPVGVARGEDWLARTSRCLAGDSTVHRLRVGGAGLGRPVYSIAARTAGHRLFCPHLDWNVFVWTQYLATARRPVHARVQRPREVRADRNARRTAISRGVRCKRRRDDQRAGTRLWSARILAEMDLTAARNWTAGYKECHPVTCRVRPGHAVDRNV